MNDQFLYGFYLSLFLFNKYRKNPPFLDIILSRKWGTIHFGGSDEDRTRYLLHAMEALSQVSYGPSE